MVLGGGLVGQSIRWTIFTFRKIFKYMSSICSLQLQWNQYQLHPYTSHQLQWKNIQRHGGVYGHIRWSLPSKSHWNAGSGSLFLSIWMYVENQGLLWTGTHQWKELSTTDKCSILYDFVHYAKRTLLLSEVSRAEAAGLLAKSHLS